MDYIAVNELKRPSGFPSPHGAPGQIVEWLRSGAVRAGLDDRMISEYEEVLRRPEFNLPRHEVLIVLRRIQSQAEFAVVSPAHLVRGMRHRARVSLGVRQREALSLCGHRNAGRSHPAAVRRSLWKRFPVAWSGGEDAV